MNARAPLWDDLVERRPVAAVTLAGRAALYAKGGLCGKPTLAPAGRLVVAQAPRRLTSKTGTGIGSL